MPELPEVETIRRRVAAQLSGAQVKSARLLWERALATPPPSAFMQWLPGQMVQEVGRRGKFLIFHLSSAALLFHLRMSGDLRVEAGDAPWGVHDRILIEFTDGQRLAFSDARKFGRAWLVEDAQTVVGGLGPEPLEAQFTEDQLFQSLQEKRRQLKPLLLDQHFLAGLGNIYTDESLHLARLHPQRLSHTLDADEVGRLWHAIRAVLQEGIAHNGASLDWVYRGGDFQNHFRAYQRAGQPCSHCGALIERLVVGQRGTHICPVCQVLPPGG